MNTLFVTGASSLIGHFLLPILTRDYADQQVIALSRQANNYQNNASTVQWLQGDITQTFALETPIKTLLHLAPIWHLPALLQQLQQQNRLPQRIIAISSTSRFSKVDSSSDKERDVVEQLVSGEEFLQTFSEQHQIHWTIFRPTLIYGAGKDKNVSTIARFVQRFGFFPVIGKAKGLRQPIHAEDIANACLQCIDESESFNKAYNLSGSETLTYRDMVAHIFTANGKSVRILSIPAFLFRWLILSLRILPKFKHLTPEMAERMNQDLYFPADEAIKDFAFQARSFMPDQTHSQDQKL